MFVPTATAAVGLLASLLSTPQSVQNFGSVRITWDITPQAGDYITYSCGPTNGLSDYINKCDINTTLTYNEYDEPQKYTGHAPIYTNNQCIFFSLVNLRCDYVFTYVRNNNTDIATVTVPILPNINNKKNDNAYNEPTQGHLAFGDLPSDMYVSWVSGSDTLSSVQYRTPSSMNYTHTIPTYEKAQTYQANELCNSPANTTSQSYWRFPGYFHHVLLENLTTHTRYYYRYGNDVDGWSDERSFLSRADETIEEIKFIGYGDQDWDEPGSVQTAALALRDVVSNGYDDFVLHFGDLSYGEGDVSDWDHWATQVEPYASRAPYMVSYGNHEYNYVHGKWKDQTLLPMRIPIKKKKKKKMTTTTDNKSIRNNHNNNNNNKNNTTHDKSILRNHDDSGSFSPPGGNYGSDSNGECGLAIVRRFRGPSNGRKNQTGSLAWYSFDAGPVHVVQMSSEHNWMIGSEQNLWLEQDLIKANQNRIKVPWILLTAHRMMYSSQLCEDGDNKTSFIFRKNVEHLLLQYQVDVVMVGHQHSYERTCSLHNGTCVEQGEEQKQNQVHGVVHITAGSAGAGVEKCGFAKDSSFSKVHSNQWGYLRGIATRTKLTIDFVADSLGTIFDQVVLTK